MGVQPHVVGAGVDKCKVGLVYSQTPKWDELSWDELKGLMSWAYSVKCDEFAEISGGHKGMYVRLKPPATYTRAIQPLASGNSVRCLYGSHKGVYRVWVGFNPTLSHLGEINFHLQHMFELGFETLRLHSAISECEFFVDFEDADFHDYLYIDTGLRSANQGFMPQGTMYLGSMHGKRSLTVYNKAKHLAEVKGIMLPSSRLRIEGKVRGGAHRLKHLATVSNPFGTLHVVKKSALDKFAIPAKKVFEQNLTWGMSAQMAYQCLSKANKAEMATLLAEVRAPWWSPIDAWANVQASLGWMDVLSQAGMTGEWLPLGEAAYEQCAS